MSAVGTPHFEAPRVRFKTHIGFQFRFKYLYDTADVAHNPGLLRGLKCTPQLHQSNSSSAVTHRDAWNDNAEKLKSMDSF